jgi:hypothetical protein
MTVDVYFDLTCQYAYRLHRWLTDLDIDADWHPFSLLEAHRNDDGPPVWDTDEHAENISLLMLAGHELVRRHDGDLDRYRAALFHAWHDIDQRLDTQDLLDQIADAGVHADHQQLSAARDLVGHQHQQAVELGVFGSSTIIFEPGHGSFVRVTEVPTIDGHRILNAIRTLAVHAPQLEHLEPLRN